MIVGYTIAYMMYLRHNYGCVWYWLKMQLFYYLVYFFYYSRVLLHFFYTIHDTVVLFQLVFNFIYSTFSKKISISTK